MILGLNALEDDWPACPETGRKATTTPEIYSLENVGHAIVDEVGPREEAEDEAGFEVGGGNGVEVKTDSEFEVEETTNNLETVSTVTGPTKLQTSCFTDPVRVHKATRSRMPARDYNVSNDHIAWFLFQANRWPAGEHQGTEQITEYIQFVYGQ